MNLTQNSYYKVTQISQMTQIFHPITPRNPMKKDLRHPIDRTGQICEICGTKKKSLSEKNLRHLRNLRDLNNRNPMKKENR